MKRSMFFLEQKEMPTHWYNIQADLPEPLAPLLHPGKKVPFTPDELTPLFPMEIIKQDSGGSGAVRRSLRIRGQEDGRGLLRP